MPGRPSSSSDTYPMGPSTASTTSGHGWMSAQPHRILISSASWTPTRALLRAWGAALVRRPRVPAARVEMRCAERAFSPRSGAFRLHVRGCLPAAPGGQEPQPRHRMVLDPRRRVAACPRRLRGLVGAGELRRRRPAAPITGSRTRLYLTRLRRLGGHRRLRAHEKPPPHRHGKDDARKQRDG